MTTANSKASVIAQGSVRRYVKTEQGFVSFGLEQADGTYINCVAFQASGWPESITSGKGAKVKGSMQVSRKRLVVEAMKRVPELDRGPTPAATIDGFDDEPADQPKQAEEPEGF